MCTHLLTPEQGRGSRLILQVTLAGFLQSKPAWRPTWAEYLLSPTQSARQLHTRVRDCHSLCPDPCQVPPSSLSCTSTAPLPSEDARIGSGGRNKHSEQGQLRLEPQGFSPNNFCSQGLVLTTEQKRSHGSHIALAPASLSTPTSYQSASCQHTPGKQVTHAHLRSRSYPKVTGYTQTVLGHTHPRIPCKTGIGNCFN